MSVESESATMAKTALRSGAAAGVPATHVVVPREPTEEMVEAGWIDKEDVSPREIFIAMLAAAPQATPAPDPQDRWPGWPEPQATPALEVREGAENAEAVSPTAWDRFDRYASELAVEAWPEGIDGAEIQHRADRIRGRLIEQYVVEATPYLNRALKAEKEVARLTAENATPPVAADAEVEGLIRAYRDAVERRAIDDYAGQTFEVACENSRKEYAARDCLASKLAALRQGGARVDDELRRLSEAATPGEWRASGRYVGTRNHKSYIGEVRDQNGNWSDTEKSTGDARFISAAVNFTRQYIAAEDARAASDLGEGRDRG